jgi:hypothetical protein
MVDIRMEPNESSSARNHSTHHFGGERREFGRIDLCSILHGQMGLLRLMNLAAAAIFGLVVVGAHGCVDLGLDVGVAGGWSMNGWDAHVSSVFTFDRLESHILVHTAMFPNTSTVRLHRYESSAHTKKIQEPTQNSQRSTYQWRSRKNV